MTLHEKILKKKNGPMGPPGYLGSLSRVYIVEFFQNLIGLAVEGLEVTPIPVPALVDFTANNRHSGPMCGVKAGLSMACCTVIKYLILECFHFS